MISAANIAIFDKTEMKNHYYSDKTDRNIKYINDKTERYVYFYECSNFYASHVRLLTFPSARF